MATFSKKKQEQLVQQFEDWLDEQLKAKVSDQASEVSIFSNYISSSLSEEDTSEEEKREAIRPFLQELNQNDAFNEEEMLGEIIKSWTNMKLQSEKAENDALGKGRAETATAQKDESNPSATDTILSMISKHKSQVVATRKSNPEDSETAESRNAVGIDYSKSAAVHYNEAESDEEVVEKKSDSLFVNTNAQEAQVREKKVREKLSEAHSKQKEQAKKALLEQKQREEERKKKAQQKAAKVERKR